MIDCELVKTDTDHVVNLLKPIQIMNNNEAGV